MALRWKRAKRTGILSPEVHELRDRAEGPILMRVQRDAYRNVWFFYGLGTNSSGRCDIAGLEEAKAQAAAHARRVLAVQSEAAARE